MNADVARMNAVLSVFAFYLMMYCSVSLSLHKLIGGSFASTCELST